jgi:hypothetical protein
MYGSYLTDLKTWEGMNRDAVKTFRMALFTKARYVVLSLAVSFSATSHPLLVTNSVSRGRRNQKFK